MLYNADGRIGPSESYEAYMLEEEGRFYLLKGHKDTYGTIIQE
jgi:hypothetical protein